MENFETPKTPLTLVQNEAEVEYEQLKSEFNSLDSLLVTIESDVNKKLEDITNPISEKVRNIIIAGLKQMQLERDAISDKMHAIKSQDSFKNKQLKDSDTGPWNDQTARVRGIK